MDKPSTFGSKWSAIQRTPWCKPWRASAVLLAAVFGATNSLALEVGLKGIIGYGVPLTSSFIAAGQNTSMGCSYCPMNNDGTVAFNLVTSAQSNAGIALFDGKSAAVLSGNLGPAFSYPGGMEINDANTVMYQRGPIFPGLPIYAQLFSRSSPAGVVAAVSQPNFGVLYSVDANGSGVGVILRTGGAGGNTPQVIRLPGDGTEIPLSIDPAYLNVSGVGPRILDRGDIYVQLLNYANNSHEIWHFSPGSTTAFSVVYTRPATTGGVTAWDVNEGGDLVVAVADNRGVAWLERVPAGGAPNVVAGSQVGSALSARQYNFAGINSAGLIGAVRSGGRGTATDPTVEELVYATAGGVIEPALVNGVPFARGSTLNGLTADVDSLTINGAPLAGMSSFSRMNEYGQIALTLQVLPPGLVGQSLVVRVDPPGSIGNPHQPSAPDVCGVVTAGWCFGDSPLATVGRQLARYYDPDMAGGYEYVASVNAFAGVRIPFAYGDGRFALYLWNDATGRYVDSGREVLTGELFRFDQLGFPNGIARFALMGIEAAVDATDPRGFVTGLTFASGTSTPRFVMKPVVGVLDSDGDGVADSIDVCPGTPANTVVDAQGCSFVQLDADGDGVPNSVDACPNTPAGALVDALGCAASQRDTDHDGVADSLDLCPNTPPNTAVNAAGCSPAQLDSDGDGVPDSVDACPGTPVGTPVDAKGCPAVQQAKACDVDKNGSVDWRDIKAILLAVGKPATGADDPRDPNRNGAIDLKDAAICTSKCDRRFCLTP